MRLKEPQRYRYCALTPATDQSEDSDQRHPNTHAATCQREHINRTKSLESRIHHDIRKRDQAYRDGHKGANSLHLADKRITVGQALSPNAAYAEPVRLCSLFERIPTGRLGVTQQKAAQGAAPSHRKAPA